jgi:hypothetical protein
MSIKLKIETIETIKKTAALRLKVQAIINVSHNTMVKYLDENNPVLTASDVLNTITEELNLPLSQIIDGKFSKLMRE